jgi:hypothetical protein
MIRSLILALAFQFITPVWATEGLIPNADITTESEEVAKIEGFVDQLDIIEKPSMDWPILPMPDIDDLLKYESGSGQELFIYGMMTAMVEKADRENFYCQKDLDAGYKPCRFGSIKPRDHYAKAWLDAYNALQVKDRESLARLARGTICPEGSFYATSFPDGSPLCAPAPSLQEMENHRFSCAVTVSEFTIALDFLFTRKYNTRYPIYDYWTFYPQPALHECKNGTVWGAGEFCNLFDNYIEASVDHWHCNEHLRQLKDLYEKEQIAQEKACDDKGWKGGNLWKPVADGRPGQGVFLLVPSYCDGNGASLISNVRVEDALGGIIARPSFSVCNKANAGRNHYRFSPSGANMTGPVFVRYDFNGFEECRRVGDPSKRQE